MVNDSMHTQLPEDAKRLWLYSAGGRTGEVSPNGGK